MRVTALALILLVPALLIAETTDLSLEAGLQVSSDALVRHVRTKNRYLDDFYIRRLYQHYAEVCRVEGISLGVALAQMVHETDYLRFTGVVRAIQYNYAGIGAVDSSTPGASFPDMRTGVVAHVQHIKAYANQDELALPLEDPRFALVRRASAPTVMALAGRWAADPLYGEKILAHIAALRLRDDS